MKHVNSETKWNDIQNRFCAQRCSGGGTHFGARSPFSQTQNHRGGEPRICPRYALLSLSSIGMGGKALLRIDFLGSQGGDLERARLLEGSDVALVASTRAVLSKVPPPEGSCEESRLSVCRECRRRVALGSLVRHHGGEGAIPDHLGDLGGTGKFLKYCAKFEPTSRVFHSTAPSDPY